MKTVAMILTGREILEIIRNFLYIPMLVLIMLIGLRLGGNYLPIAIQ
nr:MAG TPA: hypothetical protein [Caudoviricetes sp.]